MTIVAKCLVNTLFVQCSLRLFFCLPPSLSIYLSRSLLPSLLCLSPSLTLLPTLSLSLSHPTLSLTHFRYRGLFSFLFCTTFPLFFLLFLVVHYWLSLDTCRIDMFYIFQCKRIFALLSCFNPSYFLCTSSCRCTREDH